MRDRVFAFVESNTSGTGRLFARAAAGEGFRPVVLAAEPERYDYITADRLDAVRVDTGSYRHVRAACRRVAARAPIAGITSSSDYFVEMAARLAASLGLAGPSPEAVTSTRDKVTQRGRLASAGVPVPRFVVVRSAGGASTAARTLGCPVVVKPSQGSGSVGVRLCGDASEAADHAADLLSRRCNERGQPMPVHVLVEQVAEGPEYLVETFNDAVVGITAKHLGALPHFVEVGHDYPATLPAIDRTRLEDVARRALAALGLGWGPAHIEVRLTACGPRIIEVNPRLAGGYIPELVRLASGVDLIALTVKLAAGRHVSLRSRRARHGSIRFLLAPAAGRLRQIQVDSAAGEPAVRACFYRNPGDLLQRQGDFRDRLGHVMVVGDDQVEVRRRAEQCRDAAEIVVDPDPSVDGSGRDAGL